MARVALVSHDVQTVEDRSGGVGTFVTNWARLLRKAGDEVTIIRVDARLESPGLNTRWAENYRAWGIQFIEVCNDARTPNRWPEAWAMRLSEKVHPLLAGYDVAYFQDWANPAFHMVRVKRFSTTPAPVCVTVLHGASNWVRLGNRQYPRIPDDLHLDFVERYAAQHSDFVVSPSQYMLDWVRREGWKFGRQPAVLRLPYQPVGEIEVQPQGQSGRRVIFFGRLETRKGFTLFTNALLALRSEFPAIAATIDEIVLLGSENEPTAAQTIRRKVAKTGWRLTHLSNLDSEEAGSYLRENAVGAVAVIASPYENFPYAVIETSLIPGLTTICSRGGGIPEVLGSPDDRRLFDPEPRCLAAKLSEVLEEPISMAEAPAYDFDAANEAWLSFHHDILQAPPRAKTVLTPRAKPSVCVCIPYFNKARYFPELLSCLENQTLNDFGVVAVDDGSSQPEAREIFDGMAAKYQARGWKFLRQANAFVDAARNAAARRAGTDYLFFVDADELIPPHTIERMMEAVTVSGVDCLVSASVLFKGEAPPYTTTDHYMPIGANLVAGLIEPIVFGGPMILIRSEVFSAIGGYRQVRGAAHEDWELQARLAMRGYDTDILPEYLHQYRQLSDGLAKISDGFAAKQRIVDCYEAEFSRIGMRGTGAMMFALYRRCQELEGAVREDVPIELRMRLHDRLTKMLGRTE
ncbi:MAG TPA: glycosyltransferase [Bryobacteraceae bacterium]|jgi:glycosyltransferase involved in cell wall biosynthesis